MKQLVCEMCGGTDLVKQDGMFVCQTCGAKYSVEEAKKMMIEGTVDVSGSTVKIDSSKELNNLYELARRAKNDNDNEKAFEYYSQITIMDPSSWEAYFYAAYFRASLGTVGEIGSNSDRLSNSVESVFNLIKNNVANPDEQRKAVDEVATKLREVSAWMFQVYDNAYHSQKRPLSMEVQAQQDYVYNCVPARNIAYAAGDLIVKVFGDEYGDVAAACWKVGVEENEKMNWVTHDSHTVGKGYQEKISKYDPSYQIPQQKSGCYVATAVYGSYDCPQVWTLRRYRDYTLAETWYGRAFIRAYYAISPTLVKWFENTEWFKRMWKSKLDRMVADLNAEGVKDTPYEDRNW